MAQTDTLDSVTKLCKGLLDSLDAFDRDHPPYGLYASDELAQPGAQRHYYQEWHQALKPYLQSLGANVLDRGFRNQVADFDLPGFGYSQIKVVTISKVKVRKYGSAYRVDRHEAYDERWLEREFGKNISAFWKQPTSHHITPVLDLLIFLGYDKAQRPFEKELSNLAAMLDWQRHGVVYLTRTWQDIHGRGFGVRTCVWAKYSQVVGAG